MDAPTDPRAPRYAVPCPGNALSQCTRAPHLPACRLATDCTPVSALYVWRVLTFGLLVCSIGSRWFIQNVRPAADTALREGGTDERTDRRTEGRKWEEEGLLLSKIHLLVLLD